MSYCTSAQVLSVAGLSSGAISNADILVHIGFAEAVVDRYCNTRFLSVEESGTLTSATTAQLVDTSQTWTTNQYANSYMVYITGGTGSGQLRKILTNTTTALNITPVLATAPDSTSTYEIYYNTIISEVRDGNGLKYFFTRYYPVFQLQSLTLVATTVSTSNTYLYSDLGKIQLKPEAEYALFSNTNPQEVTIGYAYGVYPIPVIITEYTAILAAMRVLSEQIGGSYQTVTSYTIPELTVSKGDLLAKMKETLEQLKQREQSMRPLLPYFPNFG